MNRRKLGTIAAIGVGGVGLGACSLVPPIPTEPENYTLPPVTTTTVGPPLCTYPVNDPTSVLSVSPAGGQFWNVFVNGNGPFGQVEAQTTSDAMSAAEDVEITTCKAITSTPPEVTIPYGSGAPVPGGNTASTGSTGTTGSTGNTGNSGY